MQTQYDPPIGISVAAMVVGQMLPFYSNNLSSNPLKSTVQRNENDAWKWPIFKNLPWPSGEKSFRIFFHLLSHLFFFLSLSLSLSPSLSSAVFNLSFSVAKVLNAAKLKGDYNENFLTATVANFYLGQNLPR